MIDGNDSLDRNSAAPHLTCSERKITRFADFDNGLSLRFTWKPRITGS